MPLWTGQWRESGKWVKDTSFVNVSYNKVRWHLFLVLNMNLFSNSLQQVRGFPAQSPALLISHSLSYLSSGYLNWNVPNQIVMEIAWGNRCGYPSYLWAISYFYLSSNSSVCLHFPSWHFLSFTVPSFLFHPVLIDDRPSWSRGIGRNYTHMQRGSIGIVS